MDLRQFLGIVRARWKFVLVTLGLGALLTTGLLIYTPPTYAWYMAGLVFQWLKREGGLAEMANAGSIENAEREIDVSERRHQLESAFEELAEAPQEGELNEPR